MIALALGSCMHTKHFRRTCASPISTLTDTVYLGRIRPYRCKESQCPARTPQFHMNQLIGAGLLATLTLPGHSRDLGNNIHMQDVACLTMSCQIHLAHKRKKERPRSWETSATTRMQNACKMPCAWRAHFLARPCSLHIE